MPQRRITTRLFVRMLACVLATLPSAGFAMSRPSLPAQGHKDYLTDAEADKIRDARTPAERIKLYLSFADDRLKKFEYELTRPVPDARRDEMLNSLLNAYVGSVDDGADQIEVAQDTQQDIHKELKLMIAKDNEFLTALEKYSAGGPDLDMYKDTLEDAIDGTKDAISDAQDALKTMPAAPVRRKQ